MEERNILRNYPKPQSSRSIASKERGLSEKLIASSRSYDYFDGDRKYGYGGLIDDGRWNIVVHDLIKDYSLDINSLVLQINCEKGFFLNSLSNEIMPSKLFGTESSPYAILNTKSRSNYFLIQNILPILPFRTRTFDMVISLGNVYTLNLQSAFIHLKEIERVKKKFSFITLATYETSEEYWLFRKWSLLANLIMKRSEWIELMKESGYSGDYSFVDANTLGLKG